MPNLITRDGEYQLRDLLLNGPTYPRVMVHTVNGLYGLPDMDTARFPLLGEDGEIPGYTYYRGREIELEATMMANTHASMAALHTEVSKAMRRSNSDLELGFKKPGRPQLLAYVRPMGMELASNYNYFMLTAPVTLVLRAHDPLLYTYEWFEETATIPGGEQQVNVPAYPQGDADTGVGLKIKITGPVENPRVKNLTLDKTLKLDCTLAAGQWIEIDSRTRTVVRENGTLVNQYIAPDSQWWALLGTEENFITYSRTSSAGNSTITLSWRDGYML